MDAPHNAESKDAIQELLLPRKLEIIGRHAAWIRAHEELALKHILDGKLLDIGCVQPYLQECQTEQDHALWRYVRYQGATPYSEYVGRRQRFLIRDAGHPGEPIMGIAALGSSVMQLQARDRWIGWQVDAALTEHELAARLVGELSQRDAWALVRARRARGRELRSIKKHRIAAVADLYVSQAVPPYNELTSGKLLCLMMLSNELRQAFRAKYAGRQTFIAKREKIDLVLIVTTSVFGRHTSLYNRLRYRDRLAYIPVGETIGFGTIQVTEGDFQLMRAFLAERGKEPSHLFGKGANWRMRVIRTYHDVRRQEEVGYAQTSDRALTHGQRRGVFLAPLAENAQAYLTEEDAAPVYYDWPLADLVAWWKQRWLAGRAANPDVMARVRAFDKETYRVSRLIPTPSLVTVP